MTRVFITVIGTAALLSACAKLPPSPILTRDQIVNDRRPVVRPDETFDGKFGEMFEANTFNRFARAVDARTYGRWLVNTLGGDAGREAENMNLYDEVADSTWFTNRNAWAPFSADEMERGPTRERLAAEGPLTVVSGKSSGVTPGFVVKDASGRRFLLKFDSSQACGLASGADVISSRFLHAAGYNVPENNIEYVDPSRFILDPKAKTKGKYNATISLAQEAYEKLIGKLPDCRKDGKVRAMASRFLDGKPAGPFSFYGRRSDDPNDRIPHQHRRELRGLSIFASWINHTDLRNYNTLDMFQEVEGGNGYLLHHLIDFGATLGSGSATAKMNPASHEYWIDFPTITKNTVALGLREPVWKNGTPSSFASVGNYRTEDFDAAAWRPTHPNRAMLARTLRDGFWGARLVASFSDEQIRAAIQAADFPEEGATDDMVARLAKRRDLIARYWFMRAGSLDRVVVSSDIPEVSFFDWLSAGSWRPEAREFQYRWEWVAGSRKISGVTSEPKIRPFSDETEWKEWLGKFRKRDAPYVSLKVIPMDGDRQLAPATEIVLYWKNDESKFYWVGLKRSTD